MKDELHVKEGEKRAATLRFKAFIFSIVILGSLIFSSPAKADWQNYAPLTSGTAWPYDASGYIMSQMGKIVIPTNITNINYIKIWPRDYYGAICPNGGVTLYTNDFATSSVYYSPNTNPYITGYSGSGSPFYRTIWYGSYVTSKVQSPDGGCVYGLRDVFGNATTSRTLAAGTYWYNLSSPATPSPWCDGGTNQSGKCARYMGAVAGSGEHQWYRSTPCGVAPCNDVQKKGSVPNLGEISIAFLTATSSTPTPAYEDTGLTTRLIDFTPADGATLPADVEVTFSLHAYVAEEDIGEWIGVRFMLHNIDQNVLLLNRLSPSDFYLLDGFEATTSGHFYFNSEGYALGEGNYRLEAQLERSYLGGWVVNPFSPINDTQSHQFIVGSSTFLGNLSQSAFSDLQDFFASSTATSTEVTSRSCNPLAWDTQLCLSYLLLPSAADMTNTMLGLKDMVLTRVPWGYASRVVSIMSSSATTALPAFTVNLHLGAGSLAPATSSLSFAPDDMLAGGIALAGGITDVTYGKTAREILEPLIKLIFALLVIFIITNDLLRMSHTSGGGSTRRSNNSNETA
jgi:hypothetical protein